MSNAVNDSMFVVNHDLVALVSMADRPSEYLDVDQATGQIKLNWLPSEEGIHPAFCLVMGKPKGAPAVFTLKNTGEELGGYDPKAVLSLGSGSGMEFSVAATINVKKAGNFVHTHWHSDRPNCMSCFVLLPGADGVLDGTMALLQVGVLTRDYGKSWVIHQEHRYEGRIWQHNGGYVVEPKRPWYGEFLTWKPIFKHPGFQRILTKAKISQWQGKPIQLDPPLPKKSGNLAVVQWFSSFAGCGKGFGYTWLNNERQAAVLDGQDIRTSDWLPHRGDVVNFSQAVRFGDGKNVKLKDVQLASRTWE